MGQEGYKLDQKEAMEERSMPDVSGTCWWERQWLEEEGFNLASMEGEVTEAVEDEGGGN